jgi:hypothetical protein
MISILSKSVVLTLATLLAFPPGWCCGLLQHDMAEAAPTKTECCQHSAPEQPGDEVPTTPDAECCCSHEAAIPAKATEPTDTPNVVLFTVSDLGDLDLGSERGFDSAVLLYDSGPKLHVLQCVWLC